MATRGKQTIVQRIALDGGKQIEQELKQLGAAGEAAFKKLQSAVAASRGPMGQLSMAMNNFKSSLSGVQTATSNVGSAFQSFATRLAAVKGSALLAAGGLLAVAKAGITAAAESERAALVAQTTVEKYNELAAAAKLVGVNAQQLASSVNKLNNIFVDNREQIEENEQKLKDLEREYRHARYILNLAVDLDKSDLISKAVDKVNDLAKSFNDLAEDTQKLRVQMTPVGKAITELGIDVHDANGKLKAGDVLMRELADKFSKMKDGPEKAQFAIRAFGDELGPKLIPLLNKGSDGLAKMNKQFRELGIVTSLDNDLARIATKFEQTLSLITQSIQRLRQDFGVELADSLQEPLEQFIDWLKENRAQITITLGEWARSFGQLVKDIVSAFTFVTDASGNVHFINQEKVSEANQWLITFRDAVMTTAAVVRAAFNNVVVPAFNAVVGAANLVARAVNAIFGTEFTGQGLVMAAIVLKLLGFFRLLGAGIGLVSALLGSLSKLFPIVTIAMKALFSASGAEAMVAIFAKITGWVKAFGAAMIVSGGTAGAVFGRILAGLGRVLGVITLLVGWPRLLIAGLALLVGYWDEIAAMAASAGAAIRRGLGQLWDGFTAAAQSAWDGVTAIAQSIWDGIKQIIVSMFLGLIQVASDYWDGVKALGNAVWAGIETVAKDVWAGIEKIAKGIWDGIEAAGSAIWGAIATVASSALGGIATAVATAFQGAFGGILPLIQNLMSGIVALFTGAVSETVKAATEIKDAIARAVSASQDVGGATALANVLVSPFRTAVDQISSLMRDTLPQLVASGFAAVQAEITKASAGIASAIAQIQALMQQARDGALSQSGALPATGDGGSLSEGGAAAPAGTAPGGGLVEQLVAPYRAAAELIKTIFTVEVPAAISAGNEAILAAMREITEPINALFRTAGEDMANSLKSALLGALAEVAEAIAKAIGEAFVEAANIAIKAIDALEQAVVQSMDAIRQAAEAAAAAVAKVGSGGGGGGGEGFARGGYIYGPGTATSDSIPAWLSRGEFVVRAAAVRKYGLGFLQAINGMAASGFPRFAMGGLVDPPRLGFDTGLAQLAANSVGASTKSFDLHIGGEVFPGMVAPDQTISRLHAHAIRQKTRSMGVRPTWAGA